ncbi:MAG: 8-oxo-dGTP diphosphatase [Lachnospiraceae bacterium]|nr:8-oxo-dGTP diphosphatase [Lachnospiraceae bacterium]
MKLTTLAYIKKEDQYLMIHRTKKDNDPNHDKWIGVGGKLEKDESPDECMIREVKEETGLDVTGYRFCGIVTFISDIWETEYMFLFEVNEYSGELTECSEGDLEWVEKRKIPDLHIWEGDRIFLERMQDGNGFFSLMVRYEGDTLAEWKLYE